TPIPWPQLRWPRRKSQRHGSLVGRVCNSRGWGNGYSVSSLDAGSAPTNSTASYLMFLSSLNMRRDFRRTFSAAPQLYNIALTAATAGRRTYEFSRSDLVSERFDGGRP